MITRERGYRDYKDELKKDNNALPYIGLYLTDLTFIEDGNQTFIQNQINLAKVNLFNNTINSMAEFQNCDLIKNLKKNEEISKIIYSQIWTINEITEVELYNKSLQLEPRVKKSHS